MEIKQEKMNLADYDDDVLDILYQWAQCAILCGTPTVQHMIAATVNEYESRRLYMQKKIKWKVKIAGMWVKEYALSRVTVSDDEKEAFIFDSLSWLDDFSTDESIEVIKVVEKTASSASICGENLA